MNWKDIAAEPMTVDTLIKRKGNCNGYCKNCALVDLGCDLVEEHESLDKLRLKMAEEIKQAQEKLKFLEELT